MSSEKDNNVGPESYMIELFKPNNLNGDTDKNIIVSSCKILNSDRIQIENIEKLRNDLWIYYRNNSMISGSSLELEKIVKLLADEGSLTNLDFICPWFIIIMFLEINEESILFSRVISNFSKITKTNKNIKNSNKNIYINDLDKIVNLIEYLTNNDKFSKYLKIKLFKGLQFTLTILKRKTTKNVDLIQFMIENNDLFLLDLIISKAKNSNILKSYDKDEISELVIFEIYYKLLTTNYIKLLEQSYSLNNTATSEYLIDLKEINYVVFQYIITNQCNELMKLMSKKYPNTAFLSTTIQLAIEQDCFDYLKESNINEEIIQIFSTYPIISQICSLINNPIKIFDCIYFLYQIKDIALDTCSQKLLYQTFNDFISNPKNSKILLYNVNPLLLYIMLSQIFYHFSLKCEDFEYSFLDMAILLKNISINLIKKNSNFYNLRNLVLRVFYPAKEPLIALIFTDKDFFIDLFKDDRLSKIIRLQLNSFYNWDYNIFATSTSFNFLTDKKKLKFEEASIPISSQVHNENGKKSIVVELAEKIKFIENTHLVKALQNTLLNKQTNAKIFDIFNYVSPITNKEVIEETNHIYQERIYIKSISMRMFFDFIIFSFFFIYVHYNTYKFASVRSDWGNITSNYSSFLYNHENSSYFRNFRPHSLDINVYCISKLNGLETNSTILYLDDCENFESLKVKYKQLASDLYTLCVFILLISLNFTVRKFHQYCKLKRIKLITIDYYDFFLFLFSLAIILHIKFYHKDNFLAPIDLLNELYITNVFIALLIFNLWLNMFQFFKLTKTFGYLVKTIELMIREASEFFWIFFMFIVAFCTVLYLLFSNINDNYVNFAIGIRTLFGDSLGGFQFVDDGVWLYQVIHAIILVVFLMFANVILINLFIAILSNIYEKVGKNSDMEYAYIVYELIDEKYFDFYYGSMGIYNRVVNFFLFPVHFFTFLVKNDKFNKFVASIGYFIFLTYIFVIFVISNIVFLPLAWLKIFYLILRNKYHEKAINNNVNLVGKLTRLIIWLIFGLVYLLILFIKDDTVNYFITAFLFDKNEKSHEKLTILEVKAFKSIVKNFSNIKKDMIPLNEFKKEYFNTLNKMTSTNSPYFFLCKEIIKKRADETLKLIKKQDFKEGNHIFENITANPENKNKLIVDIINSFAIDGEISILIIDFVLKSLKYQLNNSKHILSEEKEIDKLRLVNYQDNLIVFNNFFLSTKQNQN